MYVLGLICGFQGSKRIKCRIKNLVNPLKKPNALSSVSQVKQESKPSFLSALEEDDLSKVLQHLKKYMDIT